MFFAQKLIFKNEIVSIQLYNCVTQTRILKRPIEAYYKIPRVPFDLAYEL